MICPICNEYSIEKEYSLYDDRYGYTGIFDLLRCQTCEHRHVQVFLTNNELTNLYSNYYPRGSFDVKSFKPLEEVKGFNSWLEGNKRSFAFVPRNVRVLDIGCGLGQSVAYHNKRGCEAYGVETDKNIQNIADTFNLKIKIGTFDCRDYEQEYFDYITLDQVIEHFNNPMQILEDISSVLKPGGHVIMTTPNVSGLPRYIFGRKWINWHVPYHLHHFSKKSILLLAEKNGFEVICMKTLTSSSWMYYQWIHNISFANHKEVSKFWGNEIKSYSNGEKKRFKFVQRLNKYKINHVITRFFDFLGVGDNFLIILRKKR